METIALPASLPAFRLTDCFSNDLPEPSKLAGPEGFGAVSAFPSFCRAAVRSARPKRVASHNRKVERTGIPKKIVGF